MKNRSMHGRHAAILFFSALSLIVAAGCPARNTSGGGEPDILSAAGEEKDALPANGQNAAGKDEGDHLGKHKHFDPIEVNGKYFEDAGVPWPKPDVAILISGRQDGYLEPCGCAGIEQQKGGLSRRHTLIEQLVGQGWPLVSVDVGGQVRRFGKEAELQFAMSADALKKMDYKAVGFGPEDLKLSSTDIAAAISDPNATASDNNCLFVSANVSLFDKDSGITPRYRIVKVGRWKMGITSVLGESFQKQVNNTDIVFQPVKQALKEVVPKLKGCDITLLLAYTTEKEAEELAKAFPEFNFVAVGIHNDPPAHPETVAGTKTLLIKVGEKGEYLGVVALYSGGKKPSLRYQRVALDSRFGSSPAMKQLMQGLQNQLEELGWAGLSVKAAPHPRGEFSGTESCKECHQAAWNVWHESKHAKALETLMELKPPRQFDAECVSCHVTGWNSTDFFPYKTGYVSLKETPHLANNGCENCHGPGAAHVAAESGKDQATQDKFRAEMHLNAPTAEKNNCSKCHDSDNSPEFNFEKYWKDIEH